jgi:hypothetical protein
MSVEQKKIDFKLLGNETIQQMLEEVQNSIIENGLGQDWYLKKIERIVLGHYEIVVERIIP